MKKRMMQIAAGMMALLFLAGCNKGEAVADTDIETEKKEEIVTDLTETQIEEMGADYLKCVAYGKDGYLLNSTDNENNFGEWSNVTFETHLGNVIKGGTIWVEEWYQGNCAKSIPGIISAETEEIYIVMDVSMGGTSRVMIATDEYDGSWEVYYPFQFEAETVVDRHFMSWKEGTVVEITASEEHTLAMVTFEFENGTEEQTEYSLKVMASFEEEVYVLTDKAPGGEYPTNVFRLEEVVTIEDESRKNAYIKALKDILYRHVSPAEEELVEWTMGKNSYAIMDVNLDGKEELLIKHESVMADTKLCIYEFDEEKQSIEVLYCAYPEQTFYDNGTIIAEDDHNQTENEFWPCTLWKFNATTGIYEAVVRIENAEKDAEVKEQYIGDAKELEIVFEQLPYAMSDGAA